ncbi:pyrimidine reductase family protein, partial [Micrococcus sp. SIMBA_131]
AEGSVTPYGRAGGLRSPADRRLPALSLHDADVVLVGAGTIRAEGYEGPLLPEEDRRRRAAADRPADPPVAVVSGSLDLDPESA